MDFSSLGLSAPVVRSVERQNFTNPTDIQAASIPALMEGSDLMGVAQTGGGKTAAFLLPLIEKLLAEGADAESGMPRAIILAPTRELAIQIATATRQFCAGLQLFSTVIYGGAPYRPQLQDLKRGVHIVIATPGRLMDHLKRGSIYLDKVETFILDEADRMLDMGFIDDVKDVHSKLAQGHQTIMFSATMNKQIKNLANTLLNKPVHVEIATESTVADTIAHRIMSCNHKDKRNLLNHLIDTEDMGRTLIFTKTKLGADRLAKDLKAARMKADSIHGDRPQAVRERILGSFKKHKIQYLVATDVAARGIDVNDITHVINYDMPTEAESYVHRVGRTGRAGNSGIAISICATDEGEMLYMVEKAIGEAIEIDAEHPFHANISAPVRGKKRGRSRNDRSRRSNQRREGAQRRDGARSDNNRSAPKRDFNKGSRSDSQRKPKSDWTPNEQNSSEAPRKRSKSSYNDEARVTRTNDKPRGEKRSFGDKPRAEKRSFSDKPRGEKRSFDDKPRGEKRSFSDKPRGEKRSFDDKPRGEKRSFSDKPRGEKRSFDDKPRGEKRSFDEKPRSEKRSFSDKPRGEKRSFDEKPRDEEKSAKKNTSSKKTSAKKNDVKKNVPKTKKRNAASDAVKRPKRTKKISAGGQATFKRKPKS